MLPRPIWVFCACLTCGLLGGGGAALAATPAEDFGQTQFDEIIEILQKQHLRPGLDQPRVWAAAANGALTTAKTGTEVLDEKWRQEAGRSRKRFSGTTEALPCGEGEVGGVVLHHIPPPETWRDQEKTLAAAAQGTAGEPLVDALRGWKTAFERRHFDCAMFRAQAALSGPADAAQPQRSKVWRGAVTYLLRAIDPHSRLTTPRAWRAVNDAITQVVDLGLTFAWRRGEAVVKEVSPTASEQARLVRSGDVLRAIDGRAMRGEKQATLVGLLRRPAGASVRLSFARVGQPAPVQVTLRYLDRRVKDVQVEPLLGLPGAVRVRVRRVAAASGRQVRAALEEPAVAGALAGVLLDLRDNHGGIIPEALTLVEVFRRGGLMGRVSTRDATAAIALSRRKRTLVRAPLVVLVDGGCASACEFTTASLRDGGRALVVGGPTFGKATLQEYTSLQSSRARLMITMAMFASPNGLPIQATGIAPDLVFARPTKGGKQRGEAALPFHLTPAPTNRKHTPLPELAALRSCWQRAVATLKPGQDPWLDQAREALRCLMRQGGLGAGS